MEELNLDEMRSQIAILKEKVDKQAIVNDDIMHKVINTRTGDIKRKMRVAVICGLITIAISPWAFHHNLGLSWWFIIVTDIFIRINSKGTALSQGDFVMSKIAADEIHGGNTLRKVIDYFAHLCKDGTFFGKIKEKDLAFANSVYLNKLEWLKDDKETVYDPECDDVLRVAFMHRCKRAKLADLVALLSGRDFETREFKEEIVESTYRDLEAGVNNVINGYNFTQFMLAIRSAGFTSKRLVNSVMAIDFAYAIYLLLQESKEIPVDEIKSLVQRWYVLSVLTGRYSASPESAFAKDIRAIGENGVKATLKAIEDATLSDNFWNIQLNQNLTYVSSINPTYQVFLDNISLITVMISMDTTKWQTMHI